MISDHSVDVVVVGAGIAGLSAAAELSATRRVVVIEQELLPATHASGRSASLLNETSGHPLACALAAISRPAFEDPPPGFADHPLLTPRGLLWIGEESDIGALDALAARAAAVGVPGRRRVEVSRLTPEQVSRMLPGVAARASGGGGVHEPGAMTIDTAAVLQGYARMLRARGGSVVTAAELVRADHDGRQWHVAAGSHRVTADIVVNSAGAWGDAVAERAGVRPLGLCPLRRTAAIARTDVAVDRWPLVMDIAGRFYCEPETGGLLVSPADETPSAPCDARPDEIDVAVALERVGGAMGLELRSIVRAWAGLRTFAPDGAPVAGEDSTAPGFWWLVGQGGAGIKTAPALATLIARLTAGDDVGAVAEQAGVTAAALSPDRLRVTA